MLKILAALSIAAPASLWTWTDAAPERRAAAPPAETPAPTPEVRTAVLVGRPRPPLPPQPQPQRSGVPATVAAAPEMTQEEPQAPKPWRVSGVVVDEDDRPVASARLAWTLGFG